MASEIRVDKINSLSGVGTVTLSPTGVDIAGITTAATLRATTGIVTSLTAGSLTSLGAVSGTTGTFTGDVDIADKIIHTGDTNTAIRFPAADTITAETAGSERLRVGSGGDVSVGGHATNYADSPLEVRGTNAGGDVAIRVTNNSTTAGTQAGVIFTTTTSDFTTAGIGYERGGTADALRFYVGQSDAAGGFDNATERLRITSDGNVLTSGNTQLFGSSTSDGSDNKAIMINGGGATSDSRGGYLIVHGNEHSSNPGITRLHAGNVGTAGIEFYTAGSERLRILAAGGLTFNGDTAAANALDDYEEGTWTPTQPTIGTNSASGTYTKIGRYVFASMFLTLPTNSSGQPFYIDSLPFTALNNSGTNIHGGYAIYTTYGSPITVRVHDNGTRCQVSAIGGGNINLSGLDNLNFRLAVHYMTN